MNMPKLNMSRQLQRRLSVMALAVASTMPLVTISNTAGAQTTWSTPAASATAVSAFTVRQVSGLRAGTQLEFAVNATPDADVTLQIGGATADLQMAEVRAGVYEGTYTVRERDRLSAASLVTARVSKDGQASTASLSRSLVVGAAAPALPVQITSFNVSAPDRVRPGDELSFSVMGTPGSRARVSIKGIDKPIALTEVSTGVYEASYVVRRGEATRDGLKASAYLSKDRREVTQTFERSAAVAANGDARRDTVGDSRRQAAACVNCGRIEAVNKVEVKKGDSRNVLGTVLGGVIGGVAGNQVGGGSGKDVARVVGAIGGAYAGNRVQNNRNKDEVYRVTVRMNGGDTRDFDYADDPAVTVGTRVKVEEGVLIRL